MAQTEPAAVAEALRLVLVALVAVGWVTIDSDAVNAIVSAVAGLASIALTIFVRSRVTPVAPAGTVSGPLR